MEIRKTCNGRAILLDISWTRGVRIVAWELEVESVLTSIDPNDHEQNQQQATLCVPEWFTRTASK